MWTKIGLARQTNHNPGITIRMIEGAGHHFDLNLPEPGDSAEVKQARDAFTALAKRWLGLATSGGNSFEPL